MTFLHVTWNDLEPPRPPAALLASGPAARRLAHAIRAGGDKATDLRAVASADDLLVLGDAEALPWVDGGLYLGRDAGLLLPTTLTPSVPVDLLRGALATRAPGLELVATPDRVIAFIAPFSAPDPDWLHTYATGGLR